MVWPLGSDVPHRTRPRGSEISVTLGNAYILYTVTTMSEMNLEIHPSAKKRRVLPLHVLDYEAFKEDFQSQAGESELHLLEKFHAARTLSRSGGIDTFVDAVLYDAEKHIRKFTADLVGMGERGIIAVFCETKPPGESLMRDLEVVDESENSKAVVVYPFKVNSEAIDSKFHSAVNTGKLVIEHLNWRDRGLERAFRDVLELMEVLTNETRVKMLLPLLEQPQGKKHFREEINPKLIYENVPLLRTHKLINELSDDLYDLTPMGKNILCEYLAFVEKVRHLLEEKRDSS